MSIFYYSEPVLSDCTYTSTYNILYYGDSVTLCLNHLLFGAVSLNKESTQHSLWIAFSIGSSPNEVIGHKAYHST